MTNSVFKIMLKDSCRKLGHIEGVLHGAFGKEGKYIGIVGKGALDKINTGNGKE